MRIPIRFLFVGLWAALALPAGAASADLAAAPPASEVAPDSGQLEQDLQRLKWPQFRSVIEAIPKLKADVEKYGPIGWEVVKTNYATYGWKKKIDKLDAGQKQRLAELIQQSRSTP